MIEPKDETWWEDMNWDAQQYEADKESEVIGRADALQEAIEKEKLVIEGDKNES